MDRSRTTLYDPVVNLNPYSGKTHFLTVFFPAKNGYYGNEFVGLSCLSRFYMISNTLI